MRNILILVGSGIKGGNTDRLAHAFTEGAREKGHTVHSVFLGSLELSGCLGCGACQQDHVCIQKDGMAEIYSLFEQCDTIVLASPLYFWTVSARIKAFIERLYAISRDDQYPPKDCVLLMTAGDDQFWTFEQPLSYYHFVTKAIGWSDIGTCLAGGCSGEPGKRHIDKVCLEHARQLGRSI